jgi:hypothetical protein
MGRKMKKLPKWETLRLHYPNFEAEIVFKQIGGKAELNYDIGVFNNACATRISSALNKSGGAHVIPFIKDVGPHGKIESQVSSGKNNMWYIFRVRILVRYLTQQYGKPEVFKPAEYRTGLKERKGIIVFEVPGWNDATGHADLWDGSKCLWKGYGGLATQVLFWAASK